MQDVKVIQTNGRVTHFINASYNTTEDFVVISEWIKDDVYGGYKLISTHSFNKNEVESIIYED